MEDSLFASLVAKYNTTATIGFASMAVGGWFTVTEWAAIIGALLAAVSFIYDIYNKERQKKITAAEELRTQEEHALKMELLRKQIAETDG